MQEETRFLADVAARHAAHAAQIASALRLALDNVDTDDERVRQDCVNIMFIVEELAVAAETEADALDEGLHRMVHGGGA